MKILLIIPTLGLGGAQRVLVGLANRLANDNHDTTILTFTSASTQHFYTPEPDVAVVHIKTIDGSTARRLRILKTPLKIRQYLQAHPVDIILSFQDIANFATLLATLGNATPVIISERQDIRYYRYPKLRQLVRRFVYPLASRIVVQTELVRTQFADERFTDVTVIPNHIPTANPSRKLNNDISAHTQIICAGRLEPQKDFALIINACAAHPEIQEHCTISIFGEGALRAELENQIKLLGLEKTVFLRGLTNELEKKIAEADLFVLPSLYEGFPNVLAEAVANGLPSIGYQSVSGVTELIEDGQSGVVINDSSRDPHKLGEAILSIVLDPEKAATMRQQALLQSAKFNEHAVYEKWKNILAMT